MILTIAILSGIMALINIIITAYADDGELSFTAFCNSVILSTVCIISSWYLNTYIGIIFLNILIFSIIISCIKAGAK